MWTRNVKKMGEAEYIESYEIRNELEYWNKLIMNY